MYCSVLDLSSVLTSFSSFIPCGSAARAMNVSSLRSSSLQAGGSSFRHSCRASRAVPNFAFTEKTRDTTADLGKLGTETGFVTTPNGLKQSFHPKHSDHLVLRSTFQGNKKVPSALCYQCSNPGLKIRQSLLIIFVRDYRTMRPHHHWSSYHTPSYVIHVNVSKLSS